MPELFLELFSEEIPARMQARAADDLARLCAEALAPLTPARRRAPSTARAASRWRPRWRRRSPPAARPNAARAPARRSRRWPASCASMARAASSCARRATTGCCEKTAEAIPAAALIAGAIPPLLRRFPWPKSMRWGGTSNFVWVRPLRRIVCLLDGAVVPFDLRDGEDDGHGLASGDLTEGHRFHAPGAFAVASCADWAAKLRERRVMVDADERKRIIGDGIAELADGATGHAGGRSRPAGRGGGAGRMAGAAAGPHRRCLHGPAGRGAAGLDAGEPALLRVPQRRWFGRAVFRLRRQYRAGGRRRHLDRRQRARAARPLRRCAPLLGPRPQGAARNRACRCWTTSPSMPSSARRASGCGGWNGWPRRSPRMVGAGPALARDAAQAGQGGPRHRHGRRVPRTARRDGPLLRAARRRGPAGGRCHPRPLRAAGARPTRSPPRTVSIAVALADKLDQLVGFFAIGERPTGAGDPYALRRAALGIIRIIRENGLWIALAAADRPGRAGFPSSRRASGPARRRCWTSSPSGCACSCAPRARGTTCWPRCSPPARMTTSPACWPGRSGGGAAGERRRREPADRVSPRRQHPADRGLARTARTTACRATALIGTDEERSAVARRCRTRMKASPRA